MSSIVQRKNGFDLYLEFQYRQAGDFVTGLFNAITVADSKNLAALAGPFPSMIEAYKTWTRVGVKEFAEKVTPGHRLLETLKKEYGLEDTQEA
jgi:hypothetical protein